MHGSFLKSNPQHHHFTPPQLSCPPPPPTHTHNPFNRYDLPASLGPRSSGLSFGPLPPELYALLTSGSGGYSLSNITGLSSSKGPKHKVCIVTGS
jgi:hypothetical protein